MTRYLFLIACSICIISCHKPEEPEIICDPAIPSYEPIFIRLTDNMGTNLLGTANYDVDDMMAQQTCINLESDLKLVKGLIDGNSDSTIFLRINLAGNYNGSTCNEFTLKWNNSDTDTLTVSFTDSVVSNTDDCNSYYYTQHLNTNGSAVSRSNNMKTNNAAHDDNNGYSTYYTITK